VNASGDFTSGAKGKPTGKSVSVTYGSGYFSGTEYIE
jgi:hypothetical protein